MHKTVASVEARNVDVAPSQASAATEKTKVEAMTQTRKT